MAVMMEEKLHWVQCANSTFEKEVGAGCNFGGKVKRSAGEQSTRGNLHYKQSNSILQSNRIGSCNELIVN